MGAVRNAVTEGPRSRSVPGPARMTPGHLLVLERRSEPGERPGVGVLRRRGVADDKGRSANVVAERVAAEALDSQATDGGVLDNLVVFPGKRCLVWELPDPAGAQRRAGPSDPRRYRRPGPGAAQGTRDQLTPATALRRSISTVSRHRP